jgi:hypothetical protein
VVYVLFAQVLIGSMHANGPVGVYVGDWRTDLQYADESPPWLALLSGAWLILPPVVLAAAALVAARRLDAARRPQRNRITLVGLAIIVWWAVAAVAGQREAFGSESFQVFNRFLGLSMALVVLAAYQAPAWLRRRLPLPDDAALG